MQIPLEKRCEVFRTPQSMIGKSTLRLNCVSARLMFPDDIIWHGSLVHPTLPLNDAWRWILAI